MSQDTLLSVKNLAVEFDTYGGIVKAVRDVNFDVISGKTLAIVGESGCGKSVTVQALMGLIPMPPGRITKGDVIFKGSPIIRQGEFVRRNYCGNEMTMIFQDAMTALNPTMKIGKQIAETLIVHKGMSAKKAQQRAVELLDLTKISEPHKRAKQFPFEFSGGMLQRAMIAMSLASEPDLLIADEPTTSLDVTIQAQILELMKDLQRSEGMSIILITHDLGVVANMADDVVVMYAGEVVENASVDDIFFKSSHPYTIGLQHAMPHNDESRPHILTPIEGSPPDLFHPPVGCGYFARCPHAMKVCEKNKPTFFECGEEHHAQCWLHHSEAPAVEGLLKTHD